MSGNISGCPSGGQEGIIGIEWVEVREAAKYFTMHRSVPITKNYLVLNVNNGLNVNQGTQTTMKEKNFMRFCVCIKYIYIHTYIYRHMCMQLLYVYGLDNVPSVCVYISCLMS